MGVLQAAVHRVAESWTISNFSIIIIIIMDALVFLYSFTAFTIYLLFHDHRSFLLLNSICWHENNTLCPFVRSVNGIEWASSLDYCNKALWTFAYSSFFLLMMLSILSFVHLVWLDHIVVMFQKLINCFPKYFTILHFHQQYEFKFFLCFQDQYDTEKFFAPFLLVWWVVYKVFSAVLTFAT